MRGSRGQRGRRRFRPVLFALAASVAIHVALLVALVLLSEPGPPPPEPGRIVAVELVELPAPTAPEVPAREAPPPPGGPGPKRGGGPRPRIRGDAAGPEAHAAPRDDVAEGIAPPPPRQIPDLRARPPLPDDAEATPGDGAPLAGEAPVAGGALRGWLGDRAARARVENGLVHPYYRDVGRALLRAWDAERPVRRRGVSGYLAQAGENLVDFGRVWQGMAEGYAREGAPGLVDGSSARMKELSGLPPGPARDALAQAEVRRQLRSALSEGHVATVRVTQAADGHLLSVELVSPSRDAEIDRAALADVRAAALALPVPPPEALGGATRLVSLWELELEVSITPPVPIVALELDEVLGLKDVRVPLDRRIWKRVRLVGIE